MHSRVNQTSRAAVAPRAISLTGHAALRHLCPLIDETGLGLFQSGARWYLVKSKTIFLLAKVPALTTLTGANAAILFEPDGYLLSGPKLMGRQAAGNAFLRAAIAGRGLRPMVAYTPHRRSAEVFGKMVQAQDPNATTEWIPADRVDALAQVGTLYLPGPGLNEAARLRLRGGCAAYSLVGVTHTTASHGAMDSITGLLSAPVMPWDALICTSSSVVSTVKVLLEAETEALRWRFGNSLQFTLPQFPVIPLGVHCDDFNFTPDERKAARVALGIGADDVVALFVGRLSFHAKAHPHAMYAGLQAAAQRSSKSVTLIQCGWFANEAIEKSFSAGAVLACPAVKSLFTDGKEPVIRRQSWAAADIFISLSDNIQETFGLTPIEAMAAGLPVVVSDWDGYKDTVRDGVDGFRIPTWMPPPNLGDGFARMHEAGVENYDFYCGLTCQTVSVDAQVLSERLASLIANPALRRSLGEAGRARAREVFDWKVIYQQYLRLYADLGGLRQSAAGQPEWQARIAAAPKCAPSRLDPFLSFGHYATAMIQPTSVVRAAAGGSRLAYEALAANGLFSYAKKILPMAQLVEQILALLGKDSLEIKTLAQRLGTDTGQMILTIAVLAKMDMVSLVGEAAADSIQQKQS